MLGVKKRRERGIIFERGRGKYLNSIYKGLAFDFDRECLEVNLIKGCCCVFGAESFIDFLSKTNSCKMERGKEGKEGKGKLI